MQALAPASKYTGTLKHMNGHTHTSTHTHRRAHTQTCTHTLIYTHTLVKHEVLLQFSTLYYFPLPQVHSHGNTTATPTWSHDPPPTPPPHSHCTVGSSNGLAGRCPRPHNSPKTSPQRAARVHPFLLLFIYPSLFPSRYLAPLCPQAERTSTSPGGIANGARFV